MTVVPWLWSWKAQVLYYIVAMVTWGINTLLTWLWWSRDEPTALPAAWKHIKLLCCCQHWTMIVSGLWSLVLYTGSLFWCVLYMDWILLLSCWHSYLILPSQMPGTMHSTQWALGESLLSHSSIHSHGDCLCNGIQAKVPNLCVSKEKDG